jgi:hypothetical protein
MLLKRYHDGALIRRRLFAWLPTVVLLTVLALSLSLNVALGWRIKRSSISSIPQQPTGMHLPLLSVKNLAGIREIVPCTGLQDTVIYVFRPKCPWCLRNHQSILSLFQARKNSARFLGVVLDTEGVPLNVISQMVPFPVFTDPSDETKSILKLNVTPQTFVISRSGVVMKNWPGAYQGLVKRELENYFSISLPGVAQALQ